MGVVKELEDTYTGSVTVLAEASKQTAKGLNNEEQLHFEELPVDGSDTGPDRYSDGAIHERFSREGLVQYLADVMAPDPGNSTLSGSKGLVADLIILQSQSDWLAALERDYGLRKRGRIRLQAHAMTRRRALGRDNGAIKDGLQRWLTTLGTLERGPDTPAPDETTAPEQPNAIPTRLTPAAE